MRQWKWNDQTGNTDPFEPSQTPISQSLVSSGESNKNVEIK